MKSFFNLQVILLGLLLRFIFSYHDISRMTSGLLVGPQFTNDVILECGFLHARAVGYLASPTWCSQGFASIVLKAFGNLSMATQMNLLRLSAIVMQLMVAKMIHTIETATIGPSAAKGFSAAFYWLNPWCIVACLQSPIPIALHFLISATIASINHLHISISIMLYIALYVWSFQFLALLPCVIWLLFVSLRAYSVFIYQSMMLVSSIILTTTVLLYASSSKARHAIHFATTYYAASLYEEIHGLDSYSHSPSVSLTWYLNVQVFSDNIRQYFNKLYYFQPFVLAFPIVIRLQNSPYEAVSCYISNTVFFIIVKFV